MIVGVNFILSGIRILETDISFNLLVISTKERNQKKKNQYNIHIVKNYGL